MWTIVSHSNARILETFAAQVIDPLFHALILASWCRSKVDAFIPPQRAALLATMRLRADGVSLSEVCDDIVFACSAGQLRDMHRLYLIQADALSAGRVPPRAPVARGLAGVFSHFLYEASFGEIDVWSPLGGGRFTRADFHDNFHRDNRGIPACPYCDLDSLNANANHVIEHFHPRSAFPLLSMHVHNLIPSCYACNSGWQGKGRRSVPSAASPFFVDIGRGVDFDFDFVTSKISIKSSGDPRVADFLDLVQLYDRYSEERVWANVVRAGNVIFDTVARVAHTQEEIEDYIQCTRSGAPLTWAIRAYTRLLATYSSTSDSTAAATG